MTSPATTEPLTYSVDEAAAKLGHVVTADWLRSNLKRLPHRKSGKGVGRSGRIAFSGDDLAAILDLLSVKPEPAAPVVDDDAPVGRRK